MFTLVGEAHPCLSISQWSINQSHFQSSERVICTRQEKGHWSKWTENGSGGVSMTSRFRDVSPCLLLHLRGQGWGSRAVWVGCKGQTKAGHSFTNQKGHTEQRVTAAVTAAAAGKPLTPQETWGLSARHRRCRKRTP